MGAQNIPYSREKERQCSHSKLGAALNVKQAAFDTNWLQMSEFEIYTPVGCGERNDILSMKCH